MKRLICAVLVLAAGVASANDLGVAEKALRAKDYGTALSLYTKLANAGNADAQLRLGEMYWYGEGTAVDMQQSQAWLRKAAASGNASAADTLAALKEREHRGADIAYWTQGYQGEDLVSGKFACPMPAIPAVSTTQEQMKAVSKDIGSWETCYNGFAAALNAIGPSVNRIPADVIRLMTPNEVVQAAKHIDTVFAGIIERRQAEAKTFGARREAWLAATGQFIDDIQYKITLAQKDYDYSRWRAMYESKRYPSNNPGPFNTNVASRR